MIIVETDKNYIQSESNDLPSFACTGKCKKVWWPDDINAQAAIYILRCKACGGTLTKAIENKHFTVIKKDNKKTTNDGIKTSYASIIKP